MSLTFHTPINNVSTTVGSGYTAGSHSLVVATGTGAQFGSTFPLIITASQAGTVYSILEVTRRSTDTGGGTWSVSAIKSAPTISNRIFRLRACSRSIPHPVTVNVWSLTYSGAAAQQA